MIADLVMSLDNVIAVAAAAGGSVTLLVIGLAISIPLVIVGSTLLLHLMERFPVIITIGGALIGMVAGEMLVTDHALYDALASIGVAFDAAGKPTAAGLSMELIAGAIGAALVVASGAVLARRQSAKGQEEISASRDLSEGERES
jgi:predicted tellurium resistance membrane protein TerC